VDVRDLTVALGWLVQAAVVTVEGADFASIITVDASRPSTAAYSASVAAKLDHAQLDAHSGPSLDVIQASGAGLIYQPDLTRAGRWAKLARVAADQGVRSVLAVGLFPTDSKPRFGALTFYARDPGALTHHGLAIMFAAHAAAVITRVTATRRPSTRPTRWPRRSSPGT